MKDVLTPYTFVTKRVVVIKNYWPHLEPLGILKIKDVVEWEVKALNILKDCENIVEYICTLDNFKRIVL